MVTCCYYADKEPASCKLQICIDSGFEEENEGLDFKISEDETGLEIYLYRVAIFNFMVSYYAIYRHLVSESEAAMRLMPYGLYVGFQKKKYLWIIIFFLIYMASQGW